MKKLDQYFDKAKSEHEILSLTEIETIISSQGASHKQPSVRPYIFFQRKEFAYAISLLSLLAISTIVMMIVNRMDATQEVYIPVEQRRTFQLVKSISAHPKNSQISISQFGLPQSSGESPIPIHLRTKFELSEERLKQLGITFSDELIKYEGNVIGKGYVSFSVKQDISFSVSIDDQPKPGVNHYVFYPWFLSDEVGAQNVRYRFNNEDSLKMTNSYFFSAIDQLIPIHISRPGFKKVIFWFSQSPELMNILEASVLISGNQNQPEDEKVKINTIISKIFPTITHGNIQIAVSVLQEQDLTLSLLSSTGEMLQSPIKKKSLNEGEYNFTFDLSNFQKGLYFIRIESNPGLITIHRIFKE